MLRTHVGVTGGEPYGVTHTHTLSCTFLTGEFSFVLSWPAADKTGLGYTPAS